MITQLKYCFKWQYIYRFNIFSFLVYIVCFVFYHWCCICGKKNFTMTV